MEIELENIRVSNEIDWLGINRSSEVLEKTLKINLFTSTCILLIGLIGHSLTIFIYSQKRFLLNSSNVYLLCLAIIDSMFLLVHL